MYTESVYRKDQHTYMHTDVRNNIILYLSRLSYQKVHKKFHLVKKSTDKFIVNSRFL